MIKIFLATIFFGAAVLLFVMYIRPTYDSAQSGHAKMVNVDSALAKTREIQQLKSSLLARRNVFTQSDIDRLDKMLPDHVDNVRLVLDLDGIAAKYGIGLQKVSIQKVKNKNTAADNGVLNGGVVQNKPYDSLTLQFDVVATYNEFVALLRDLESSLRIVDLVRLNIAPNRVNNNTVGASVIPLYTFNVALKTYWLP